MRSAFNILKVLGALVVVLLTLGVIVAGLYSAGFAPTIPLLLFLILLGGWMLYAYLRYRQVRQDELVHIIATAVDSGTSLKRDRTMPIRTVSPSRILSPPLGRYDARMAGAEMEITARRILVRDANIPDLLPLPRCDSLHNYL